MAALELGHSPPICLGSAADTSTIRLQNPIRCCANAALIHCLDSTRCIHVPPARGRQLLPLRLCPNLEYSYTPILLSANESAAMSRLQCTTCRYQAPRSDHDQTQELGRRRIMKIYPDKPVIQYRQCLRATELGSLRRTKYDRSRIT